MRAIAFTGALWFATVPVLAVGQDAAPAQASRPHPTPDEDIHCAAWASIVAGMDRREEVIQAFGLGLNYFLGRYEAATGMNFDDAMFTALVDFDEGRSEMSTYEAICQPRLTDLSQRQIDLEAKAISAKVEDEN